MPLTKYKKKYNALYEAYYCDETKKYRLGEEDVLFKNLPEKEKHNILISILWPRESELLWEKIIKAIS